MNINEKRIQFFKLLMGLNISQASILLGEFPPGTNLLELKKEGLIELLKNERAGGAVVSEYIEKCVIDKNLIFKSDVRVFVLEKLISLLKRLEIDQSEEFKNNRYIKISKEELLDKRIKIVIKKCLIVILQSGRLNDFFNFVKKFNVAEKDFLDSEIRRAALRGLENSVGDRLIINNKVVILDLIKETLIYGWLVDVGGTCRMEIFIKTCEKEAKNLYVKILNKSLNREYCQLLSKGHVSCHPEIFKIFNLPSSLEEPPFIENWNKFYFEEEFKSIKDIFNFSDKELARSYKLAIKNSINFDDPAMEEMLGEIKEIAKLSWNDLRKKVGKF